MVVRRQRARARGIQGAAADRRGDDLAGPHRSQDRAELPRPDRPRARRVTRGRRGQQPAERDIARTGSSRACGKEYSDLREQRGQRQPAEDRLPIAEARRNRLVIDWSAHPRRRTMPAGRHRSRRLSAERAGPANRLDPVLPDVGVGGPLPGHSRRSQGRSGGDESVPRRAGAARADRPGSAPQGAGRLRHLAGRQ